MRTRRIGGNKIESGVTGTRCPPMTPRIVGSSGQFEVLGARRPEKPSGYAAASPGTDARQRKVVEPEKEVSHAQAQKIKIAEKRVIPSTRPFTATAKKISSPSTASTQ
ncbi:unnamed protein product [Linum trigynum]|uniref:Uncharacterized protein n=1 Tax=Linum trigynum TaxID=586398 RepID=A0AAV2G007_9ROSI